MGDCFQAFFGGESAFGMNSGSQLQPQSNNLYSYTENNPIDYIDPSGLNASFGGGFCIEREWVTVDKDGIPTIHWERDCFFTEIGGSVTQPIETRPATETEIGILQGAIASVTDNKTENGKKCNDFLTATLKNLGNSVDTDIMKIFKTIAQKNGGITVTNEPVKYGGFAKSTADQEPPILEFREDVFRNPTSDLAKLAIHEVIHASGKGERYTHYDMALVMKKTAQELNIINAGYASMTRSAKKSRLDLFYDEEADLNNVSIISDMLDRACFGKS